MKVLHINCNYMGTVLHQVMIDHLNEVVEENRVFCPVFDGSTMATKPKDYAVISNCFKKMDRYFFFKKQAKIKKALESAYNVNDFDIIHAYTLFTDGNCAYELHKKYGKPYVVAIRATDIEFFMYRINLRHRGIEILKNATKIFFLAEPTRNLLLKKYVPKQLHELIMNKSLIIPNGIDDFWLDNQYQDRDIDAIIQKFKDKKIDICCVAQIIKRKNIPLIQNAIDLLRKDGWDANLTVIGKTVDKEEYERIVSHEYTTYIPPVPKEELIQYYRKSDIFVLPSVGETFGLVYAEAMSQGLPVIYTKGEGFDGQFEEGVVGYGVDPEIYNIKEAVISISKLSRDNLRNISENAEKYRWTEIVKEYVSIYKEIEE